MKTPAVILWCLHGAVGAASDWLPWRGAFAAAGLELRGVDLWRYLDCCPRSLADTALALNAEAQPQAGVNILLGYSMGGRIALHALLAESSHWDAAILVSAHPGLESESEKIARREKDADWSVKCLHGEWETFLSEWQEQGILQGGAISDRVPLRLRRKEIARSFLDWSLGAQEPLWSRLGEVRIPVLWLTGAADERFTVLAQRAAARMPQARHEVIANAGHRLPWQQERVFADVVMRFARQVAGADVS
jgi:2-succinyl-6-hydroxy-2,4-cyclohexadiene-1-carboxylate synthase